MWEEWTRWHAPRGRVRVDARDGSGAWSHAYDAEERVGARPPEAPFAVYLADQAGRFRFVVFDLDAKAAGSAAAVREDAAFLAERLDEAGLVFMVAASGPSGGLHLWVPVNDRAEAGAPAALVRRIARAAAHRCPTLDVAPLLNPRTGCVRPPGAPHRDGGFSRLVEPATPEAAAGYCEAAPNTIKRLERLADALGAAPDDEHGQDDAEALGGTGGIIDRRAVRLVGRRRPMPAAVAALLEQAPDDGSAHLARIFTGLALARWSAADVAALCEERAGAPGLEHLRTRGGRTGRRRRGAAEARAVMERQWRRQVAYAARLPKREQASQDTPEVRALVEAVAEVEEATRDAEWWRPQAGASDARALLFVARMVLEALADTVEVDCRRLADGAGVTPSTASRALRRLVMDGRLALAEAGEGRRAHAYRLTPRAEWTVTKVRVLVDAQEGADSRSHGQGQSGPRPGYSGGGTQATPRPAGPAPTRTREALLAAIRERLEHAAHDVWTHPGPHRTGGLGRHVETTAAALAEDPPDTLLYNVKTLVRRTGYTPATLARHLHTLVRHGLAEPQDGHWHTRPDRYDQAARELHTAGTRERRRARYEAERAAWHAWLEELEALRSPRGSVSALFGLGERRAPRYPRTGDGRPDHAAARRRAAQAA